MLQKTLILVCSIFGVLSAEQYPEITPCKEDDTVCLTRNSNTLYKMSVTGDPSLNIENLDPICYRKLVGNLDRVKYTLYNTTVAGLYDCNVVKTNLDLKKSTLQLDLVCPTFYFHGFFDMRGRLFTLPIVGDGNYVVVCYDYRIHINAKINVIQNQDGVKHLSLKSYEVDADLHGDMITNMLSLDYGDIVKKLRDFMNVNYKTVSKELQGPVLDANVKKLIKNLNEYLKTIPLHELIDL